MATKKRASKAAAFAPMSDAAVAAKTGRSWAGWVAALDRAGARRLSHKEIAELVHARFGVGPWWAQSVTVGYERLTGKRASSQTAALRLKRVWAESLRDLATLAVTR